MFPSTSARCVAPLGRSRKATSRKRPQAVSISRSWRALHQRLVAAAVFDQVGDGADLQLVLGGEFHQVGQPRHGAVVAHDFAQHRGGREAREAREVAAGLGVPGAHQHAAVLRDQRKHVPGLDDVGAVAPWPRGHADGQRAVVRRDAGGDALGGLDRDGEVGAVARAVLAHHRPQAQARRVRLGERHADQAAAVRGEEVDLLGRHEIGGEDEVALVLAVLVVDQHDDVAGADLGDDLGDRARDAALSRFMGGL